MAKFTSTRHTSNTHLPINHNRVYLAVYAETSDVSFSFDNDNTHVPFASTVLVVFDSNVCPTNDVFINGSSFVVIEGIN